MSLGTVRGTRTVLPVAAPAPAQAEAPTHSPWERVLDVVLLSLLVVSSVSVGVWAAVQ